MCHDRHAETPLLRGELRVHCVLWLKALEPGPKRSTQFFALGSQLQASNQKLFVLSKLQAQEEVFDFKVRYFNTFSPWAISRNA